MAKCTAILFVGILALLDAARIKESGRIARDMKEGQDVAKTQAGLEAALDDGGSPTETVNKYCDAKKVAKMHGFQEQDDSLVRGSEAAVMSNIMNNVVKELTDNSIDQMVKDIFSFYICVRWVPDEVFWNVAEQELAADILQSVVEKSQSSTQAIGELYQNFKFVPLLCSQNLKVYGKTSEVDHTYFTVFKEKVNALATSLDGLAKGPVWQKLRNVDELFCNGKSMNSKSCDADMAAREFTNKATAWMGELGTHFDTKVDRWIGMENIFKTFKYHDGEDKWNTEFSSWKSHFPFHSFIAKPEGADTASSPTSGQRFLVCFGKRVASELHRRPRGNNIITDQNTVGCHGFWGADHVSDMLKRTVALWKPPTCDLAEMSYHMKKEILKQFMRMNEQLFDALPSMVKDEELEEKGELDEAIAGPPSFNVASVKVGDVRYFDGTRVAASKDFAFEYESGTRRRCWVACTSNHYIKAGQAGTVKAGGGNDTGVPVLWDVVAENATVSATSPENFKVMPHEYGVPVEGVLDKVGATLSHAAGAASDFVLHGSFWGGQYTSLANMMSGSIAKWVVCPLSENVNLKDLDENLGTEDVVFREFVKEAYSKWTGYEAKLPGEQCAVEEEFADSAQFPGCQVCEISQLHVAFPEKYFKDGQEEDFMCPVVPPLEDAEQLNIFKEKKGMCLLHMTDNHNRQFQWHYNGHHPARRQNAVQPNAPQTEYELVKLLEVSDSPGKKQIHYGRTCTVEEQSANPRFCRLNELHNPWTSVTEMANAVSGYLQGSLGMPVGAVADLISNVQELVKANTTTDAAQMIGEKSWNALMGLGRLAHTSATALASEVAYSMPASDKRHARLESELFGASHGGDFVHSMAYQKNIGDNGRTSNARERFRRYAVVCPCNGFDPAMELAERWHWQEVVLRSFKEGHLHNNKLLNKPSATVSVRAEATLFHRDNTHGESQNQNSTWFSYGAAIDADAGDHAPAIQCEVTGSWLAGYGCKPATECVMVKAQSHKEWREEGHQCKPKDWETTPEVTSPWKRTWDKKLAAELGGAPLADVGGEMALKGLTITLYCGAKKDFGKTGPPTVQPTSLKDCMERGIRENAAMKSEKPWKLYFPDEVVVVAMFDSVKASKCISTDAATQDEVCAGAAQEEGLDSHLGETERTSVGGVYRGLRTGSGFPAGTLKEVVLRPEDVLEVNGLLV